jgi:hypothetical protein
MRPRLQRFRCSTGLASLICCALAASGQPGLAASASWSGSNGSIAFEIKPQPLAKALSDFSAVTGIEVLVDARNAEGLESDGATGVMTPRRALTMLLRGSALIVQEYTPGTVTLMKPAQSPNAEAGVTVVARPLDQSYFARIQRAVLRALCRDDLTSPGDYRLALRIQIDPTGAVTRAIRLDTTGDAQRDRLLDALMSGLAIGEPPPPELPQPVAIIVRPQVSQDSLNCPVMPARTQRASGQ